MTPEALRWALEVMVAARPSRLDVDGPFAHWLNTLSFLATALERAGGALDELRVYERDGLTFTRSERSAGGDGGIAAAVTFRTKRTSTVSKRAVRQRRSHH